MALFFTFTKRNVYLHHGVITHNAMNLALTSINVSLSIMSYLAVWNTLSNPPSQLFQQDIISKTATNDEMGFFVLSNLTPVEYPVHYLPNYSRFEYRKLISTAISITLWLILHKITSIFLLHYNMSISMATLFWA